MMRPFAEVVDKYPKLPRGIWYADVTLESGYAGIASMGAADLTGLRRCQATDYAARTISRIGGFIGCYQIEAEDPMPETPDEANELFDKIYGPDCRHSGRFMPVSMTRLRSSEVSV